MFRVGIITASDRCSRGEREDLSGPLIRKILEDRKFYVERYVILPDDDEKLYQEFLYMSDHLSVDLILTTGGTGLSPRDVTPEATKRAMTRDVPGIAEAIRAHSMQIISRAMLSRGVSGIRNSTLIVNLPGSPKAVEEILDFILESIDHGLLVLKGKVVDCGRGAE